ncbi:response regulator [Sphingomonas abietis]|uniref:Response regulator n=1 Tax=Sphingomonas abietis TaxID=3012344 RepID=A0ABY7NNA2_9SPHN|nr:response regulator [Sphingomonas abietis]WBO23014.1 response regulator [Sphingomonas abietis]
MTSRIRILCVDDDPDIRTITALALGLDAAIEVRTAASGVEALEAMRVDGWWPDAVLLDMMMPVMDGPAVLAAIRMGEEGRSLPVIFMTARAGYRDLEGYRDLGAAGVIVKPFDPLRLAEDVRVLIGQPS